MDAPLDGVGDPRLDAFGEVPDALGEWAGYRRQDFGHEKVHDLLVAKAVGAGDVITHTLRFKHVPHLGLLQVPKLRQEGLDSAIREQRRLQSNLQKPPGHSPGSKAPGQSGAKFADFI